MCPRGQGRPRGLHLCLQLQPCAQLGFCKRKKGGLKQKLECFCLKKVAIGQHVEQTATIQANWVDGGLGAKPTVVGQFLQFFEKITILKQLLF